MANDNNDDALALRKAVEQGRNEAQLAKIEFIVDVLDRADEATALARLRESGYESVVWDDPIDKSLSICAACMLWPTLASILNEKEKIRNILVGLNVAVEDWGTLISR